MIYGVIRQSPFFLASIGMFLYHTVLNKKKFQN